VKLAEAVVAQVHRSGGEVSVDGEDSPILGCATGSIKGVSDRLLAVVNGAVELGEVSGDGFQSLVGMADALVMQGAFDRFPAFDDEFDPFAVVGGILDALDGLTDLRLKVLADLNRGVLFLDGL
ncbi:hypothetical protein, partial [Thiocystis violacea]|uniref:hypothetical protein n=1 Tax=Thiocystis violacea TaxID=13725 RepID=UPI001A925E6A